ncbi:MAG: D-glycero-alpha-D-manno-heptose-1,7-bisphosphate 7-phosphatase [Bacteroidales bacterium]
MKKSSNLNKAVFLDRDGVINREKGNYIFNIEDFEFNEGIFKNLALMRDNGFFLIIITNQGGIARGLYTHEQLNNLHAYMNKYMAVNKIYISEIYYCPHHPSTGKCLCRKPESLMIEKAISRFSIDRSRSFMIGDNERDTEAARRAGVKGILINANEPLDKYLDIIIGKDRINV